MEHFAREDFHAIRIMSLVSGEFEAFVEVLFAHPLPRVATLVGIRSKTSNALSLKGKAEFDVEDHGDTLAQSKCTVDWRSRCCSEA